MLSTDLFRESWLYKDGLGEGKAEGRHSRSQAADLRLVLNAKFPGIGTLPEIDRVDRSEALDKILLASINATGADEVHSAIDAALRVN